MSGSPAAYGRMRAALVDRRTVFTSEVRQFVRIAGVNIEGGLVELNMGEANALRDWLLLNVSPAVSEEAKPLGEIVQALRDCIMAIEEELNASGVDEVEQHPVLKSHQQTAKKARAALARAGYRQ